MPLHLATFLHAHIRRLLANRNVSLQTGVYGDLPGNIQRAVQAGPECIVVALEWSDCDARLGIRQLGGWTPEAATDIVESTERMLLRLESTIAAAVRSSALAICPPTLPLPPFSHEPSWQAGTAEASLHAALDAFLVRISKLHSVRIVSTQAIDRVSPSAQRLDVNAEINTGFPYTLKHADSVGELLGHLVCNTPPKKGIITDLDDTLWRGILGEDGIPGISWSLSHKSHIHGLYQQFLAALAARGVLTAIVSKNEPALVAEAFRTREDLLIRSEQVFPIEAGWRPKSEAVARVLKAWNISADSVVFVDDSQLELEEVLRAHPGIETFRFPTADPAAAWNLILKLQDLFGKTEVREEDRIRLASLRSAVDFKPSGSGEAAGADGQDEFLEQAQAVVTVSTSRDPNDGRVLELINKTNQFNLNGRRFVEAEWRTQLGGSDTVLLVISYQDKFGPLGKIAAVTGRVQENTVHVTSWVMSCRAFARRIEYQTLKLLFSLTGASEVLLDYEETQRNSPTRDFLETLITPDFAAGSNTPVRILREDFEKHHPRLFHTVNVLPI